MIDKHGDSTIRSQFREPFILLHAFANVDQLKSVLFAVRCLQFLKHDRNFVSYTIGSLQSNGCTDVKLTGRSAECKQLEPILRDEAIGSGHVERFY